MRTLLALALTIGLLAVCRADIQDPPSNDYGPTRKLGRGFSNLVWGVAEFPVSITTVNTNEGNSAAAGYGVVRGVGRSVMRIAAGVAEIFTFAVPIVHGTYLPVLDSDTHWIHGGYKEFPPELGNESKYPYVRHY